MTPPRSKMFYFVQAAGSLRYQGKKMRIVSGPTGIVLETTKGNVTAEGLKSTWHQNKGQCVYCRVPLSLEPRFFNKVSWDHAIPRCRGGSNTNSNIVPSCRECNTQKGTLTAEEFRLAIAGVFVPLFGMLRASHVCST